MRKGNLWPRGAPAALTTLRRENTVTLLIQAITNDGAGDSLVARGWFQPRVGTKDA